ncbi:hypothetical protein [Desulfonatronovibrio hydrogenovorans]|uniref:hypothetical protein n=1 Tax=Desulfonatronovibrio hydrogenovorans TaxID=53245 RepID=UPI001237475D|nr:hypothetical protein [Desulfonatronovibrio hydrogenovorans]
MKKNPIFTLFILALLVSFPCQGRTQEVSAVLAKDHSLHSHFLDFAHIRIRTINRSFVHTPENIFIEARDALFVGRYLKVDPSTITVEVKPTNSGMTPFIGIMQYIESTYESHGPCQVTASQGPFSPVRYRKITEIFRYVQNSWE